MVYVTPKTPLLRVVVRSIGHVASRCYPAACFDTSRTPVRAQFPRSLQTRPATWPGAGQGIAISGGRSKKRPLTQQNKFSPFGYVSDWTDWQGLSPLSWLSYLPNIVFRCRPGLIPLPVSSLARSKAPHASLVEQAFTGISPGTLYEACCGLNPQDGITPAFRPHPLEPSRPLP